MGGLASVMGLPAPPPLPQEKETPKVKMKAERKAKKLLLSSSALKLTSLPLVRSKILPSILFK